MSLDFISIKLRLFPMYTFILFLYGRIRQTNKIKVLRNMVLLYRPHFEGESGTFIKKIFSTSFCQVKN